MGVAMVKHNKQPAASRRNFLTRIWIGLGVVALLQMLTGSVFYFFSGRKSMEPEKQPLLEAGPVSDFPPGTVTYIARGHLYLSCLEDGGFLALSKKNAPTWAARFPGLPNESSLNAPVMPRSLTRPVMC